MADSTLTLRNQRENAAEAPARSERETQEDTLLSETAQREKARSIIADVENNYLPEVPQIPGYHSFWASTTSTTNTIHHYSRRGYTPISLSEIPADKRAEYQAKASQNKAEYAGMVTCNEMLAMKLPQHMYQEYMKHFHHDLPLQHDARMVDATRKIEAIAPGSVKTGEGFEQGLGAPNKGKGPPVFE